VKPEKALGQHFLRDPQVLEELAALVDVGRSAGVLEIGPGEGALTAFLVGQGPPVIALDKDPRAAEALRARFGAAVQTACGDAVHADLEALLPAVDDRGRRPVVAGNLPYNVASAIYRRLLGLSPSVARLVLMLQREVAQRIVALPGTRGWGIPSIHTALVARAHLVREVPPEAFTPRPKVWSAILYVEPLPEPRVPWGEVEGVVGLAQQLLQWRRKVLRNTGLASELLEAVGAVPSLRAEDLTLDQLIQLYRLSESAR
jgi:16S rRNA (adenine1518-N6/adenine1519-N6)-dimethyltransferase